MTVLEGFGRSGWRRRDGQTCGVRVAVGLAPNWSGCISGWIIRLLVICINDKAGHIGHTEKVSLDNVWMICGIRRGMLD